MKMLAEVSCIGYYVNVKHKNVLLQTSRPTRL